MKKIFTRRRLRYGSVAILLTVCTVAAVIIINSALSALSAAFGWYIDMSDKLIYGIGEDCENYLESKVFPLMDKQGAGEKIEVILCEEERTLDDTASTLYVLNTIKELEEKYPERIEISHLNVWENPKLAHSYGITSPHDVVFKFNDKHTTLSLSHFYVATDGDMENPTAYNGERRIASAILRVVSKENPMCYFTLNHGEGLDDSELMNLLADAGYNYSFIDLAASDIPADCDLLLTVNPTHDLHETGESSQISETSKLEKYMSNGGKYMFFVSADTFVSGGLDNFESFLETWGVDFVHSEGDDGIENIQTVRDTSNAVTVDGYTFFADTAKNSVANKIFDGMDKQNVFGTSGVITPAKGFNASSDGMYSSKNRIFAPIITSYASAEAWTDGYIADRADDTPFTLMSLTTEKCENGKTAYLYVGASVSFCLEDSLQSNVYGNSETILRMISHMGNDNIPLDIKSRPLSTPPIQSLSTKNATVITVLLCAVPTLLIASAGVFVIVRRRRT